jgi:RING-box protein 1
MEEVKSAFKDDAQASRDEESSSGAPRFEIKKWNAVAMWSWDICADTCAICRNSLNEPSIEYQVLISIFKILLIF